MARCAECDGVVARRGLLYACVECGKPCLAPPKGPDFDVHLENVESVGDGITIPDYSEPMLGFRAWRINFGTPLLYSVIQSSYYWPPGEPMQAECPTGHGTSPGEDCSCGIYSAKTLEHLQSMGYHSYDGDGSIRVVGQVNLWGKIVEGSQGWRSQFAYPRELWVPYEAYRLAKPLRDAYGVPVKLMNFLRVEED